MEAVNQADELKPKAFVPSDINSISTMPHLDEDVEGVKDTQKSKRKRMIGSVEILDDNYADDKD